MVNQAPVAQASDALLMRRAAKRDVVAFRELVERHSAALYRTSFRMLNDQNDAEDVAQEVFEKLWKEAPKWQHRGYGLTAWLYRVAINLCIDRHRGCRLVITDNLPELEDDSPAQDHSMQRDHIQQSVKGAFGDLPERYRVALMLSYYEGLSNAHLADVLELNIKAMESLLFRARKRMRELLEQRGVLRDDLRLLI